MVLWVFKMWLNSLIYCLQLAFELEFKRKVFPISRLKMNLLVFSSSSFRVSLFKCKSSIHVERVKMHMVRSKTFFLPGAQPEISGSRLKLPGRP